ncbi:MAG: hypothetical protein ABEJ22_04540 [Haloferacaceae archaeon]
MDASLVAHPLQFGGVFASPLGKLFAALVIIGVVILVGRLVLHVAWRLVTIAAVIVGILLLISMFVPGLLG